ncbi:hypothetical protein ElyMa_001592800 [Elysia marginata]|uniref:DUF19 domain-containing protein n=1 Tax=Elysia marginata TaxID=1093978 RepID=A0AAV4JG62_9GAST|nr:hypothetical protein ElyMa_001592800 [Elysia marginata]
MESGSHGTWSFLALVSYPSTVSEWTTKYNGICNSKDDRKECAESSTCTDDNIKKAARWAILKADLMCSTNGLSFFRRIYTEASACLGNLTKVASATTNRNSCKALYENTITDSMSLTEKCNLLDQTRTCDRNFIGNMCGDLYRWMVDASWMARIQVYFNECHSTLSSSQFAFP